MRFLLGFSKISNEISLVYAGIQGESSNYLIVPKVNKMF